VEILIFLQRLNSEITDLAVLNEVVNVCEILKLFIAETYLVNTI